MKFKALLLVQSFAFSVAMQSQEFVITMYPLTEEVDLAIDDVFINSIITTTRLCRQRDGNLWRGTNEKSEVLMKLFVYGLSHVGGIVADMTISTCIIYYNIQIFVYKFFNRNFNIF